MIVRIERWREWSLERKPEDGATGRWRWLLLSAAVALFCTALLMVLPALALLSALLVLRLGAWSWLALVAGEEISRLIVVAESRRRQIPWSAILFGIWLSFTALEGVVLFRSGEGEGIGKHWLWLGLLGGGVFHLIVTLIYVRLPYRLAFPLCIVAHLAWNFGVLMIFPETREALLAARVANPTPV